MLNFPFDPIQRAHEVEQIVMQGDKRMYYRFRYARFYGGVVTADAVGCNLLCAYCWNYDKNEDPMGKGAFSSPSQVSDKLLKIAQKNNCGTFRMSGCEPFLGQASRDHLFKVIELVQAKCYANFIIETNGIMLGANPDFLDNISTGTRYRIAVKGHNGPTFEQVTGATCESYKLQLKGIQAVTSHGLKCTAAIMPDFVNTYKLIPKGVPTEREPLKKYAGTAARLKARGL